MWGHRQRVDPGARLGDQAEKDFEWGIRLPYAQEVQTRRRLCRDTLWWPRLGLPTRGRGGGRLSGWQKKCWAMANPGAGAAEEEVSNGSGVGQFGAVAPVHSRSAPQ